MALPHHDLLLPYFPTGTDNVAAGQKLGTSCPFPQLCCPINWCPIITLWCPLNTLWQLLNIHISLPSPHHPLISLHQHATSLSSSVPRRPSGVPSLWNPLCPNCSLDVPSNSDHLTTLWGLLNVLWYNLMPSGIPSSTSGNPQYRMASPNCPPVSSHHYDVPLLSFGIPSGPARAKSGHLLHILHSLTETSDPVLAMSGIGAWRGKHVVLVTPHQRPCKAMLDLYTGDNETHWGTGWAVGGRWELEDKVCILFSVSPNYSRAGLTACKSRDGSNTKGLNFSQPGLGSHDQLWDSHSRGKILPIKHYLGLFSPEATIPQGPYSGRHLQDPPAPLARPGHNWGIHGAPCMDIPEA